METNTYQIIILFDKRNRLQAEDLAAELRTLDFSVELHTNPVKRDGVTVIDLADLSGDESKPVHDLVELVIRKLPIDFDELELLVEGESKIIKRLNDKVVLEKFKPTVYSYTQNRYGNVEGTEESRVKFTAEVFRKMTADSRDRSAYNLRNAFLATLPRPDGTIIIQRRMVSSNLEVRVKRFHIGSPVHRYKYTERQETVREGKQPLQKWDRFDEPVVCFDWRLPLTDESGTRLADEPISDDYAAIWMENVPAAKELARNTFKWLEQLFSDAGLTLIDICFFIDQSGTTIFGEISPDCMRIREGIGDPSTLSSFDKDVWRNGDSKETLKSRYERLYEMVFNNVKIGV